MMSPGSSDSQIFRDAIAACLPRLRFVARVLTRNAEKADDLVHDTIVNALAGESSFTPGTNITAWLMRILRNRFISDLRRDRIAPVADSPFADIDVTVPPGQISALEFSDLRRALLQISEAQREAILLVVAAGLTYEEAAEVCDCAVGTVKSRVNRAREELRRLLQGSVVLAGMLLTIS